MTALAGHLLYATLFATAVAAAVLALGRASARLRYGLLLVALLRFAIPPIPIPWSTAVEAELTADFPPAPPVATANPAAPAWDWTLPVAAVWTAGAAVSLTLWLVRRRRFLRSLEPLFPAPFQGPIPIHLSASAPAPLACGILRPRIVLPAGLPSRLTPAELDAVLLHESLHIRHRDNLGSDLAMLLRCLYWFHPLVWWLDHRLLVERELARDEEALEQTDREAYLSCLIRVCTSEVSPAPGPAAMAASNLQKRKELILSKQNDETNPILRSGTLTLAGLAAVATSLVLISVPVTAQDRPLTPYEKWLSEDVAYLITPPERAAFIRLTADAERERFIEQFWLVRDPTPGTLQNEVKEEHYRRIAYSNQRFGTASNAGWRTPRGRLYIVYGPPDEIESFPSLIERWRYRQGTLAGMTLEFDLNGP